MNQAEIEFAARQSHACPNVRKGAHLLLRFMQSINEQSDGWAYWPKGRQAAAKLIALLKTAGNIMYPTHGTISNADLIKAITPIRSMVTRQKRIQKERYGNMFNFDVDAALKEIY